MRRPAVLVLSILLLGGCARLSDGGGPPPDSGIEGMVVIGPTCPVEIQGSPCPDRPASAPLSIRQNGQEVAHTRSLENGTFKIVLAPGSYSVVPVQPSPGIPPTAGPVQVTVKPHEFAHVRIVFDSGIR